MKRRERTPQRFGGGASVAVSGTITCSSRAVSGCVGSTSRTTPEVDTSVCTRRLTTPGFAPGAIAGVTLEVVDGAAFVVDPGGAVAGVAALSTKLRDGGRVD
jgi:hypothetical protein